MMLPPVDVVCPGCGATVPVALQFRPVPHAITDTDAVASAMVRVSPVVVHDCPGGSEAVPVAS